MQIQIARVDQCKEPSHIVGFAITHRESGKSVYLDAFVPLHESEGLSREELVAKAYSTIKPAVDQFEKECTAATTSIVGKTFDPSTGSIQ